ncbi:MULTISPECIES: hypothetical protein [unclassified Sphingobacterium]|uniref:hypothetical protein n=1 Tax=unclassified Sphingobacterium TaxID=2609468 RepID=UPI001044CBC1|nr:MULTISPECIES: hypothetical protein [unclassified Sphingobacterium]MCS3556892.1 ABC-type transport system involved in multi-copper enzyme maturation permease subunit [Sphingobacterium sp. JUb21]TCQ98897.1 hypothetical protein EDF66_1167 [Sphingobacterium sp. JUb20]
MGNIFEKKTFNWIVIVFCVQFFCLNILLGDFSGINDGITRIGFPFVFFQDTGGKCENCENLKWFNIIYLLIDVILCLILAIFMVMGVKRITKK